MDLEFKRRINCIMSAREQVEHFFQAICQDRDLQNKLKPPCPANRQGFVNIAQEGGYSFTSADIDEYVRFYQFYEEFQAAIDRHQSNQEELSVWLQKWQKHIRLYHRDNDRDKLNRYMDG